MPDLLSKREYEKRLTVPRPPLRLRTTRRVNPVVPKSLAHIFCAFNNRGIEHTFTNGRYLNQELVDKGFAKVL